MAYRNQWRSFKDWIYDISHKDDAQTLGEKGIAPINKYPRYTNLTMESLATIKKLNANQPVSIYMLKKMLDQIKLPYDPYDDVDIVLKAKLVQEVKTKQISTSPVWEDFKKRLQ